MVTEKLLLEASILGPFFSKRTLFTYLNTIPPSEVEMGLSESVKNQTLSALNGSHYFFKSRLKYKKYTSQFSESELKKRKRDKLLLLSKINRIPGEFLAILHYQNGLTQDASSFFEQSALGYMEIGAWYYSQICLDNIELLAKGSTLTKPIKRLRSVLSHLIIHFKDEDQLWALSSKKNQSSKMNIQSPDGVFLTVQANTTSTYPTLDEFEKQYILEIMAKCNQNKTQTARILGLNRTTLIMRMKKLGLIP